jgi:hypothetical protein
MVNIYLFIELLQHGQHLRIEKPVSRAPVHQPAPGLL